MIRSLTLATVLASLLSATVLAQAQAQAQTQTQTPGVGQQANSPVTVATPAVANFTVFIDPPTGFVFVKLPEGWRFVGQSKAGLPSALPVHVRTTLLPVDAPTVAKL